MMPTLRLRLTSAGLLIAVALGAAACSSVDLIIPAEPLESAAVDDLVEYATEHDENPGALLERYEAVESVSELAMELETEHPELFVRWGLAEEGEAWDYWLLLTDVPDSILTARIAALPVDVRVIVGPSVTSAELGDIKAAVTSSLNDRGDVYAVVSTRTDPYTSDITVEYALTSAGASQPASRLREFEAEAVAAARLATRDGLLRVAINFEPVAGLRPPCPDIPIPCPTAAP